MSEEMVLAAGSSAAPAPSAMIARPATRIPRALPRSDRPSRERLAIAAATLRRSLRFPGCREHLLNAARGLAEALLVFDQSDSDEAFAFLAEADTRGHRDMGFGQQALGKFHRAEVVEPLGDRRPGEHRRPRFRDRPAGAAEALDQHVAALAVQ